MHDRFDDRNNFLDYRWRVNDVYLFNSKSVRFSRYRHDVSKGGHQKSGEMGGGEVFRVEDGYFGFDRVVGGHWQVHWKDRRIMTATCQMSNQFESWINVLIIRKVLLVFSISKLAASLCFSPKRLTRSPFSVTLGIIAMSLSKRNWQLVKNNMSIGCWGQRVKKEEETSSSYNSTTSINMGMSASNPKRNHKNHVPEENEQ